MRAGISVTLRQSLDNAADDCDVVLIDSKQFRSDPNRVAALDRLGEAASLWWFDTTDSTGTVQSDVMDHVGRYYKAQLLVDRSLYATEIYGSRLVSDYYHRRFGVEDPEPARTGPPLSPIQLGKLRVSWNSGLGNYSRWGWELTRLYAATRLAPFLRAPRKWSDPKNERKSLVAARFGYATRPPTQQYQRSRIAEVLADRIATGKVGRGRYLREMEWARTVVSPFGWGEITLRDFEAFIAGALLIKPDMSHLETWPPFYENDVTYLPFGWDVANLDAKLEWARVNPDAAVEIAIEGQRRYRAYVADDWGREQFVMRFCAMVAAS